MDRSIAKVIVFDWIAALFQELSVIPCEKNASKLIYRYYNKRQNMVENLLWIEACPGKRANTAMRKRTRWSRRRHVKILWKKSHVIQTHLKVIGRKITLLFTIFTYQIIREFILTVAVKAISKFSSFFI